MPPPARAKKISSAVDVFESTIKKNAQHRGDESGMFISNMVRKKGLSSSGHPSRRATGSEAQRAAEKLKKRTSNMKSKPMRNDGRVPGPHKSSTAKGKTRPSLRLKSPQEKNHPKSSDRSSKTETTSELSVDEACITDNGWSCTFDDSENAFSEYEDSTVGADDDDFSLLDESSFQEPDFYPDSVDKNNKPAAAAAVWANGFAVAYQSRSDSDSEDECQPPTSRPKKTISVTPGRPTMQKASSLRNMRKSNSSRNLKPKKPASSASAFAITYQRRAEESDSDFDTSDMRQRIRAKQGAGPGIYATSQLQRSDSFKLDRSNSSRSIGNAGEVDCLNTSISSLNSRALRKAAAKKTHMGGSSPSNMLIGGHGDVPSNDFFGASDTEVSDARFSHNRRFRKAETVKKSVDKDDFDANFDEIAFASVSEVTKPRRPRKYGAAAAAEILSELPPAFRTIAKKQQDERLRKTRLESN